MTSAAPPPPAAPEPPQPTGPATLAWSLGFLILACVPFVSSVIASIAMVLSGLSASAHGGVVGENGRRAANWGLTYLLLTVVLVGSHFGILFAAGTIEGFFPFGLIILTWVAVSIAHVVICILGMVRVSQHRVLHAWAIPFYR